MDISMIQRLEILVVGSRQVQHLRICQKIGSVRYVVLERTSLNGLSRMPDADELRSMGMDVVGVIATLKKPDETALNECKKLGEKLTLKMSG